MHDLPAIHDQESTDDEFRLRRGGRLVVGRTSIEFLRYEAGEAVFKIFTGAKVTAYSAQVSACLQIGDTTLTVAKTNGVTICLAEPSPLEAPEWSRAILTITIDGEADAKEVILVEGLCIGQQQIRYATEALDW